MYKLLMVDDSTFLLKSAKEFILDGLDSEVTIDTVCNGREACDYVQKTPPDLVLMDICMPVMGGLEAVKEMRSGNYKGPIILWSTDPDSYMLQAEKNGATLVLDKLEDQDRICDVIQEYLI